MLVFMCFVKRSLARCVRKADEDVQGRGLSSSGEVVDVTGAKRESSNSIVKKIFIRSNLFF